MTATLFSGQTKAATALFDAEAAEMEKLKQEVLEKLADLSQGKLAYDYHFPWWQKHVFGDASFAHEVVKKALRAASLVAADQAGQIDMNKYVDNLEDDLFDLLNFTVMWLALRWYKERKEENDADSTHRTEELQPFAFG